MPRTVKCPTCGVHHTIPMRANKIVCPNDNNSYNLWTGEWTIWKDDDNG